MVSYTLHQLECFVAAARAPTTMEAAQSLHLSQSALSTAVANMEQALGVQLFVRQPGRRMTLTPAGSELLDDAGGLLTAARAFEDAAREHGSGVSGRLAIGTQHTLAQIVLPRVLEDFARLYPDVRIEHLDADFDTLHQALIDGTCELAVAVDHWKTGEIVRVHLAQLRPFAVLPTGHRLAQGRPLSLAELAAEPLVLLDAERAREYYLALFEDQGLEPTIGQWALMYEFVARGAGVSVVNVPAPTIARTTGDPLVFVAIEGDVPPLDLVVGYKAGASLTRRAEVFIERCLAAIDAEAMPAAR